MVEREPRRSAPDHQAPTTTAPSGPSASARAKDCDRRLAAVGLDLDRTVRSVAHPAREVERARGLTHEPAKSDALHATAHDDVNPHYWPSPALQPCDPTSGTKRTGAISCVSNVSPFRRTTTSFCSAAIADRNEQSSAVGQLLEQRLRHRRRAGADENRVVRRVLAPADGSVAEQQRHVAHALALNGFARRAASRRECARSRRPAPRDARAARSDSPTRSRSRAPSPCP